MAIKKPRMQLTSLCDKCPARCCKRTFGYAILPLTPEEAEKPLFRQHRMRVATESSLLPPKWYIPYSAEGACPFLGGDNRCRIYDRRPQECRAYLCYDNTRLLPQLLSHAPLQPHVRFLALNGYLPGQSRSPLKASDMPPPHGRRWEEMVGAAHTLSEAQDEQLAKLTSCPYPLHEEWASAWDYVKLAGLLGLGEWEAADFAGVMEAIATHI